MSSQKLVDVHFPGFSLGAVFGARSFNIVKDEVIGKTENRSCATCGALYVSELRRGPGNEAYPRGLCSGRCSPIVWQQVVGEVRISKSGKVRVVRWSKDIDLDF
jgi:hypothetical protein